MKHYRVGTLFTVLVRCPVHTPVRTPMYGLPLSQSDQTFVPYFNQYTITRRRTTKCMIRNEV